MPKHSNHTILKTPMTRGQKKKMKNERKLGWLSGEAFGLKGSLNWGDTPKGKKHRKLLDPGPVIAPLAVSRAVAGGRPQISSTVNNGIRIRHRELVTTVDNSVEFTVNHAFVLNPGLFASFPWLSTESLGFERYVFHAVKVEYYTRTSATSDGSVMLGVDYDGESTPPESEQAFGSFQGTVEDVVWKDLTLLCSPKDMQGGLTSKYIRNREDHEPDLERNTDSGIVYLGMSGADTLKPVGKVWVDYDVEFFTPHVKKAEVIIHNHFKNFFAGPNASTVNLLGDFPTSSGGLTVLRLSNNSFVFTEPGTYRCDLWTQCLDNLAYQWVKTAQLTLGGTATTFTELYQVVADSNVAPAIQGVAAQFVIVTTGNDQTISFDFDLITDSLVYPFNGNQVRVQFTRATLSSPTPVPALRPLQISRIARNLKVHARSVENLARDLSDLGIVVPDITDSPLVIVESPCKPAGSESSHESLSSQSCCH